MGLRRGGGGFGFWRIGIRRFLIGNCDSAKCALRLERDPKPAEEVES